MDLAIVDFVGLSNMYSAAVDLTIVDLVPVNLVCVFDVNPVCVDLIAVDYDVPDQTPLN